MGFAYILGGGVRGSWGTTNQTGKGALEGVHLLYQYLPSCRGGEGWEAVLPRLLEMGWGKGQVGVGTHQQAGQPGLHPPGHSAPERGPAEPSWSPVARQLAHPQPSLSSENVSIPWSPCPDWGCWRQGQERVLFTSYPWEGQLLLAEA